MTTRIHINRPRGHYIGQVRHYGARRWATVTGHCKSPESAMSGAMLHFEGMFRARVLFVDESGWYDPNVVMEASR